MSKISISLVHPFSAKAIGLNESELYDSHSKPHELAMLALQNEEYKVSIDYFTGKWIPYKKTFNSIIKCFWPITFPLLTNKHIWRQQKSFFHKKHLKTNPPDITIINMSGHGSSHTFDCADILLKLNKPYIAMIGGIHMSKTGRALRYYQNAAHLIVHTNLQKKELQKNKDFKKLDIRVMPLGVDTDKFTVSKKKKPSSCNLLFVGRISRLKQIELAILAVEQLVKKKIENIKLTIIGPFSDEEYFEELKKMVIALKIAHLVEFKGEIPFNKLIPFYQNADLFLMPSAHESFGMVMVESMACGTPVIALKGSGGPEEIIENNKTGFLCDKENFSEKVYELLSDDLKLKKFSINSRLNVEQKWSINQTIISFKESVESVLNK